MILKSLSLLTIAAVSSAGIVSTSFAETLVLFSFESDDSPHEKTEKRRQRQKMCRIARLFSDFLGTLKWLRKNAEVGESKYFDSVTECRNSSRW